MDRSGRVQVSDPDPGGFQPLGVGAPLVAQNVVFGSHDEGRWQPSEISRNQWSGERVVAAVIGASGKNLHPDNAEKHIGGFMLMSDWSARDIQAREMKQTLGPVKSKDTATSYGPYLVTPDELVRDSGNAFSIRLTASVNGRRYSEGNLRDLYWTFGQLLAYASRGTQLVPGDVIGSGTVGTGCILELSLVHGVEAYPFLKVGDHVQLDSDGLGSISARITAGSEVIALR